MLYDLFPDKEENPMMCANAFYHLDDFYLYLNHKTFKKNYLTHRDKN